MNRDSMKINLLFQRMKNSQDIFLHSSQKSKHCPVIICLQYLVKRTFEKTNKKGS